MEMLNNCFILIILPHQYMTVRFVLAGNGLPKPCYPDPLFLITELFTWNRQQGIIKCILLPSGVASRCWNSSYCNTIQYKVFHLPDWRLFQDRSWRPVVCYFLSLTYKTCPKISVQKRVKPSTCKIYLSWKIFGGQGL